jgi:outer membrane protein TolC
MKSKQRGSWIIAGLLLLGGCASQSTKSSKAPPTVAPTTQPVSDGVPLGSQIPPLYREMLAIDLPTVAQVASAQNIDIRQAKERVEASKGRLESSVGAFFPVIAPGLTFEHVEGSVRAVNGPLLDANFNSFQPAAAIQWALNPGRVVYDVIASKKRLLASEERQQSTILETLRASAVQYYDLVLAQARLASAQESVAEAEELLRITRSREKIGAGLPADVLRAQSALAGRQQDLAVALNVFYQASVTLSVTLHLDSAVTLVPQPERLTQTRLVRDDFDLGQLLAIAVEWRPDLKNVRDLAAAATADRKATAWGGFGPQVQAGYQYGGVSSETPQQNFGLHEQQRAYANLGWAIGVSTFGQIKTASAVERQALLEIDRQLDQVRAQVVRTSEESQTNTKLIPMAKQQVESAQEALRLAQENLRVGTMLALDVLQAQDALSVSRVRYAEAVARYNQSQVNLVAAIGLLKADSVTLSSATTAPTSAGPATAASGAAGRR